MARKPEDLDRLFAEALNAGDLEGLLSLYEPQAALTPSPGKVVVGSDAIREALQAFLAMKPTMDIEPRTLAETGDLALTSARWRFTGTGPDGTTITMEGISAEVCRRQPDGGWLFVIDNPHGLTGDQ